MAVAGKVAITPKGLYVTGNTYDRLDMVSNNNKIYIARKNTNVEPTGTENTDDWMFIIESDQQNLKDLAQKIDDLQNEMENAGFTTTTNMFKPTLATTTQNGVTCTSNGDGTYTFDGIAEKTTVFVFGLFDYTNTKDCYLAGCPKSGSSTTYKLSARDSQHLVDDYGAGASLVECKGAKDTEVRFVIYEGKTVTNQIFKPMITTDPFATYDDFVQYTGSSGMLNNDVSKIVNQLNDHTVLSDVPASAKFTDTITGVQNNLVSTLTKEALSAYQGKVLNDKITDLSDNKVNISTGLNGTAVPEAGTWFTVYAGGGSTGPISGMIIGNGSTVFYKSDSSMTARVSNNILQLSKSGFSMSAKTFY